MQLSVFSLFSNSSGTSASVHEASSTSVANVLLVVTFSGSVLPGGTGTVAPSVITSDTNGIASASVDG